MTRRNPTDQEIDKIAAAIADADDDAQGAWPEFEGDDGLREHDGVHAYRFLLSGEDQERYRAMARSAWFAMPDGEAPAIGAEAVENAREQFRQIASRAHAALARL
ncbi:hypothetical protein ABNQ39_20930 [Azospirillum sp. A26]|uniref:hypothetical protein n=1 Tax=Azospirillum sp. A26 TaxID=3160607 RepID=UPI00366BC1E1